jgi:hypothetical protein
VVVEWLQCICVFGVAERLKLAKVAYETVANMLTRVSYGSQYMDAADNISAEGLYPDTYA